MPKECIPPKDFELCTQRDEFIWDRPVWIAELEDGTEIWQDDDRPGIGEPSAWIRLGHYVTETNNLIRKLHLRFRSNSIVIPRSTAYYFTRGALGSTGSKKVSHFACVGHLNENNLFEVVWYRVPEIIPFKTVMKSFADINGPEVIHGSL
jgi:hypothetical protein